MTGIVLIAKERESQIAKHGYTAESDREHNQQGQLKIAAIALLYEDIEKRLEMRPSGWSEALWRKINIKSKPQRMIISGALIAAELDRINGLFKPEDIEHVKQVEKNTDLVESLEMSIAQNIRETDLLDFQIGVTQKLKFHTEETALHEKRKALLDMRDKYRELLKIAQK